MVVHVVGAHPVESSFNATLFAEAVAVLRAAGHEVDALDLHADGFEPVMSRAERLAYDDTTANIGPAIAPYVARLRAASHLVVIHPVWNNGYPAILKGWFDRVFLPGVSFRLQGGRLVPNLDHIDKVLFVATYGSKRWQSLVLGDPPRRVARNWGLSAFGKRPAYLALYGMPATTLEKRTRFIEEMRARLLRL